MDPQSTIINLLVTYHSITSLDSTRPPDTTKTNTALLQSAHITNMQSTSNFMARANTLLPKRDSTGMSTTMIDLLITLLVLVFVSLCLTAALFGVRKIRRSKAIARQQLPTHNASGARPNHRRLTVTATPYGRNSAVYVHYDEKSSMMSNPASPPLSPVPEIRITFPDEHDEAGRPKSGRVVVVRVGDNGVQGLEPVHDEQLPAYQKETGGRFASVDLDRVGGLKEKNEYS